MDILPITISICTSAVVIVLTIALLRIAYELHTMNTRLIELGLIRDNLRMIQGAIMSYKEYNKWLGLSGPKED